MNQNFVRFLSVPLALLLGLAGCAASRPARPAAPDCAWYGMVPSPTGGCVACPDGQILGPQGCYTPN